MFVIRSAEFVVSATHPGNWPPETLPEIAFAGRSNVGKSSLINCLVNRKKLVKTSSKPGRTRLLNFFNINDAILFVDLPGYGYAKVSKAERGKWGKMIEGYLLKRRALHGVVWIVDMRRTPGPEEISLQQWFGMNQIPFLLVATKADKLSKNQQGKQMAAIARAFNLEKHDILQFSAKTRQGKEQLWERISVLCRVEDA